MPDTKKTGTSILFKVAGTAVAGETECSFSVSGAEIDMSNKSTQYWREYLPGRSEWEASGSGMIMFDTAAHTLSASQKALWTAITTGAQVEVEIALTATLIFTGLAFFTSFEGNFADDDPATISWAVRGVGALALEEGE